VPLCAGALETADRGVRTGGDRRNREHVAVHAEVAADVDAALEALAYDPQTSGGLLAAVAPEVVDACEAAGFTAIGGVETGRAGLRLV
jgi:selenide,water dikinase